MFFNRRLVSLVPLFGKPWKTLIQQQDKAYGIISSKVIAVKPALPRKYASFYCPTSWSALSTRSAALQMTYRMPIMLASTWPSTEAHTIYKIQEQYHPQDKEKISSWRSRYPFRRQPHTHTDTPCPFIHIATPSHTLPDTYIFILTLIPWHKFLWHLLTLASLQVCVNFGRIQSSDAPSLVARIRDRTQNSH